MAHGTENVGQVNFTQEESKKLAKLLKHPSIGKILNEIENEEGEDK